MTPTPEALEYALRLAIARLRPQRVTTGYSERPTHIDFGSGEYGQAAVLLSAHLSALSHATALVEAIRTALAQLDAVNVAMLGLAGIADAGDTLESALAALDAGGRQGKETDDGIE